MQTITNESQQAKIIPEGAVAVFRCTHSKRGCAIVTDKVTLPIRATVASRAEIASKGRIKAARRFKRLHDLHPCAKVDCEFVGLGLGD